MKKIYVQISTHWDREWYVPFQRFRYGLVDAIDQIFSSLKNNRFDTFVFDGQSIVAEDYLEILPQNTEKFKKAVTEGKIKLGPWYVMPDELLVSGESIIRNFLMGIQTTQKYGGTPYRYGYVNDVFGHIAQFPQILNGFGIQMAYVGRGVGNQLDDKCHFVWCAPNGSQCFTYHFSYAAAYREYHNFVTACPRSDDEKNNYLRNYLNAIFERSGSDILLLNITDDHAILNDVMLDMIDHIKAMEEFELHWNGFADAYCEIAAQKQYFPVLRGELTTGSDGKGMRVVTDSISSYYPLKRENDYCQNKLERFIAPMIVYSAFGEKPLRTEYLQLANRFLLQNQPHDSICGCSADQVHKDMIYRYDQVHEIIDTLVKDFSCCTEKESTVSADAFCFSVFNPAPFVREQIITVKLTFNSDFPTRFAGNAPFQPRNMFRIFDSDGRELPYQILNIAQNEEIMEGVFSQKVHRKNVYTVCFFAHLRAFTETFFSVKAAKSIVRPKNIMRSGDHWVENEHAYLEINSDGTINLTDKHNGKSYRNLLRFIDDADLGNGWFYENAVNAPSTVTSFSAPCTIEKTQSGALQTTFRVTIFLRIPSHADYDTFCRSEQTVILPITSEITLKNDSGKVYICTTIHNCAKDHRLRLQIPTGITSKSYTASQAFYFAEKKVGVDQRTTDWLEADQVEKHFNGIMYQRDNYGNGLAFSADEGIHQGGVTEDGVMSIVLFRAFGRANYINKTERAQLQEKLTFCYTLMPLDASQTNAALLHARYFDFNEEIVRFGKEKIKPNQEEIFAVSGKNIAVSILKPAEYEKNAFVLRLFNASAENADAILTLSDVVQSVWSVNMAEEKEQLLAEHAASCTINMPPHVIQTILLTF